jgi:aspartate aminotransferase, cytoplasmic
MKASASMFDNLPYHPRDPIFALTEVFRQDAFPQKVNLGQGTYRDDCGQPWVLPSVAKSRRVLSHNGLHHEYLPILGLPEFRGAACGMALGTKAFKSNQGKVLRVE